MGKSFICIPSFSAYHTMFRPGAQPFSLFTAPKSPDFVVQFAHPKSVSEGVFSSDSNNLFEIVVNCQFLPLIFQSKYV